MDFRHITFIINPNSNKTEPILSLINKMMDEIAVDWEIALTKKNISAGAIAKEWIGKTDLIVVYGGDGCVTEVAAALHHKGLPMAIIPAGTANVMAKELGISTDTTEALSILKAGAHKLLDVDMGLMNEQPFLLRVNIGIMADMVLEADRDLKNSVGQIAYGITALKTLSSAEPINYKLEIDGQPHDESGVSLTVTNSGHIGIGDFSLQPGISITDGLLDVILMRDAGLMSVLKVAGSTLLQTETEALSHWTCREIDIRMEQPYSFICDDHEETAQHLSIKTLAKAIQILIPSKIS